MGAARRPPSEGRCGRAADLPRWAGGLFRDAEVMGGWGGLIMRGVGGVVPAKVYANFDASITVKGDC